MNLILDFPILDNAACKPHLGDVFFPSANESPRPAKDICDGCPAKTACLQWALDHHPQDGIWGGTTAQDRRGLSARELGGRWFCLDCPALIPVPRKRCEPCRLEAKRARNRKLARDQRDAA